MGPATPTPSDDSAAVHTTANAAGNIDGIDTARRMPVLMICTLVIGWVIWALIVFQYGQTPAKQLLHMRVICVPQARTAGWLRMFFREVIAKTLIGFLASFTLLIPYFWLLWDKNRQELWDKMATTLVVSDPRDLLRPQPQLSDSRAATLQR